MLPPGLAMHFEYSKCPSQPISSRSKASESVHYKPFGPRDAFPSPERPDDAPMTDISVSLTVGDACRHVDEAGELGYFGVVPENAADAVGVVAHVIEGRVLCPVALA